MSREVVAIDIDEVLFPFVPGFAALQNERYGTNLIVDDFFSYEFHQVLDLPVPETIDRVYDFVRADHGHIMPLPEAQTGLARLSEKYDLSIVTARHPEFTDHTKAWLDRHFADHFASLTFIGYAPIMEKPQTKVSVCRDLGAIALIDDSLGHVSECAADGLPAVLEYFDAA
ncbi:MAG TPA: hypothetical protein VG992_01075 [Candidatus Saccharimonadales bacterium]|nr:hypothetical protein [Candidatus Saccharimonadales bacterium]